MIKGTIMGEIKRPIIKDRYGIWGLLNPRAAKVPRTVAKMVDAMAIMKLFFTECVHWVLFIKSSYQRNE